jgi:hypothetical protein
MTEALASRRQGCAWGVLRNTLTLEEWDCLLVGIAEIDDYGGCRLRMPVPATETQLCVRDADAVPSLLFDEGVHGAEGTA